MEEKIKRVKFLLTEELIDKMDEEAREFEKNHRVKLSRGALLRKILEERYGREE